jgi:hypothetical protein
MSNATKRDKEINYVRALKQEAHDLIDAIAKTGVRKDHIYARLAHRLGRTKDGMHFSQLYTEREVTQALAVVRTIHASRMKWLKESKERSRIAHREANLERRLREEKKNPPPVVMSQGVEKRLKNQLSLKDQREALGRMKQRQEAGESTDGGEVVRGSETGYSAPTEPKRAPWWRRILGWFPHS